jgi:hypothetical protein
MAAPIALPHHSGCCSCLLLWLLQLLHHLQANM